MTHSFDLLTQPWIPCADGDGNHGPLSLHDALVQAHDLREIHTDSPLTTAALHRLLLAVLHRCFGPADRSVWKDLWQRGQWDSAVLDDYFARLDVGPRFDLFDAEHPFYQVRTFCADKEPEVHPISQLAPQEASGNNTTLFDHHMEVLLHPVPVAEAARRLVTAQAYALGFGQSHRVRGKRVDRADAPSARGVIFFTLGKTLFQTLLLSMRYYPQNNSRLPDTPADKPAWEMDNPFEPERSVPDGYLDYLTWQSRQIRLGEPHETLNGELVVCSVQQIQGLKADKTAVLDPLRSYRTDNKGNLNLRGFSPGRVLWRDSTALLELTETAKHDPPENFRALAEALRYSRVLTRGNIYHYAAIGMTTEKNQAANVAFWRAEYMPLPLAYLESHDTVDALRRAIERAEWVEGALNDVVDWLAWLWLYPTESRTFEKWQESGEYKLRYNQKKGDKKFQALRAQLDVSQAYWWRLAEPFRETMVGLADDDQDEREVARREWHNRLRAAAREAFQETITARSDSARMFRAIAEGQRILERELGRILRLKSVIQEDSHEKTTG
jgi:CRISPR system Cascade subunit CasA